MKVFLSWSGTRSKATAELLSEWLKCVIQAIRPWISSRDIDRGALWFSQISDQLNDSSIGIVCLTQENKNKPWILFEVGALAKGLSQNRVCTFLIDLKSTDLEDPLAQFNHTFPTKASMSGLVRTLNSSLKENSLEERVLNNIFETYWPQFEQEFAAILTSTPETEVPEGRSEQSILMEILETTRGLNTRVRKLETRTELNAAESEAARLNLSGVLNAWRAEADADKFLARFDQTRGALPKTAPDDDEKLFVFGAP
jgi:hypothetical protein